MTSLRKAIVRGSAALLAILGSGAIYVACSSCCIRSGSQVLTPAGLVPIETLEVGDVVLSWDFRRGALVENRVEETYRKLGFSWVRSALPGGEVLEATADHEAYDADQGGYVAVGQVQRFARLAGDQTLAIEAPAERETRYGLASFHDLTLASEPRNYVANGVVVHNKTISPFGKPTNTGPISAIITPGSGGGTNPETVSPIGGIAGGPIGDVVQPQGPISGPIGGSTGGPISAINAGSPSAGAPGGGGGGTTPPGGGGTGDLSLVSPFPNTGSPTGNEVIYLAGTGIIPGITVSIGGRPASVLGIGASDATGAVNIAAVRTPTGIAGSSVNVFVSTPDGDSQTLTSAFTFTNSNVPRFKVTRANNNITTDKWYVVTTGGNILGDADSNGISDLEEALASAIGPTGAAGDFTGTVNSFLPQLLSFTNQYYRNNPDGSLAAGGVSISFLTDRDEGGRLIVGANGVLSPLSGSAFAPDFVGDYNIMAFRKVADPFGSSGVVGQAIAEPTLNSNPNVEGNAFFLNQNQANGNELGIFTNSTINFWNGAAIANSQRTLAELAEEYAATLAHEVGHSIGREHTDDPPAAPANVNIMSATATFDITNVYAFDDARFNTMLGYMPGSNRRLHAVAFAPRTLVRNADVVLIGTPHELSNGQLSVNWHETLSGQVTATGGQVSIGGFDPSAAEGPATLNPLGRVMFFLRNTAQGLRLRDVNATIGLDMPSGPELDLVIRDYLALAQLSSSAQRQAYSARVATSLTSNSGYLRTATLVELSLDRVACRSLSAQQLAPIQALLAAPNARWQERVLASQFFLHRADPTYVADLINAALASDDPVLLKSLAGALESTLGLAQAASRVKDRLVGADPAQVARVRVLLGWLRDASATSLVADGLADDAQACAAADALGRIGSDNALPALEQVAADMNRASSIRHCALRAIGRIASSAATAWLNQREGNLPDGDERDAVRFARDHPWTWTVR